MAKCLKTVICILFLISLSACGTNQEHTANSDTEATPEKQEYDLQTEKAAASIPSQEMSQEMDLEEKMHKMFCCINRYKIIK